MPWHDQLIYKKRRASAADYQGTVYDTEQSGVVGLVRGDRIEIAHLVITTGRHSNGIG
jgi:hypothetical protein